MTVVDMPEYPVDNYDGDEANSTADIVTALLGQNFAAFPQRIMTARRISRPITIHATDTDRACTIIFRSDHCVVCNGVIGEPGVTVSATMNQIMDLAQLRMKGEGLLPVGFFTTRGRRMLGAIVTRGLVIKGLLVHPVTTLRVIALVSVVE